MRYVVKDFYECFPFEDGEVIFRADSYEECEAACESFWEDTDGECDLVIDDTQTGWRCLYT